MGQLESKANAKVWVPTDDGPAPLEYPHRYWTETINGVERLCVATRQAWCELVLALAALYEGPYFCVYERNEPVADKSHKSGPMGLEPLAALLRPHARLLESWPVHTFWVCRQGDGLQIALDEHNLVYVYGDFEPARSYLASNGFENAPFELPTPHIHLESAELAELEPKFLSALRPA